MYLQFVGSLQANRKTWLICPVTTGRRSCIIAWQSARVLGAALAVCGALQGCTLQSEPDSEQVVCSLYQYPVFERILDETSTGRMIEARLEIVYEWRYIPSAWETILTPVTYAVAHYTSSRGVWVIRRELAAEEIVQDTWRRELIASPPAGW